MKNRLYLLLISFALTSGFVFAQVAPPRYNASKERTAPVSKKNEIPNYTLLQNQAFAHWSYGISVGGSTFDGDIKESGKGIIPTSNLGLTFGGNIERSFNPVFGLGLEYIYIPYGAEPEQTNYKLKGLAHEGDLYLSVNVSNLFYRNRPQKWGVFFNVGMGLSYYNAKMTDLTTGAVLNDPEGNPMNLTGGLSLTWPFALTIEYNASKYIAIGLKGEYRSHSKDNYEGYVANVRKGNWNDAFEIISLTFRHKIHLNETHHVRNLSYGDPNLKELNKKLADLEDAIKKLKPGTEGDTCCASNAEKIAQLEKLLRQKRPVDTVVRVVVEPAPVPKGIVDEKAQRTFKIALRGIQFETARSDIKVVSYPIMEDIVEVMKENPSFELDIIGHTDNVGDDDSNQDLSDRRAHSVRAYLMNKGISGIKLTSWGRGESMPIATNATEEGRALNRRVEFVVKEGGKVIFKTEEQ